MNFISKRGLFTLPFLLTAGAAYGSDDLVSEAIPATFVEDTGAAIRIEAGDNLRIVSQEIPAAACHLHNGVAAGLSAELLEKGITKFDKMLAALRNGDPEFGIFGGEETAKMARLLDDLNESWQPFRNAALAVQADPSDLTALDYLYANATKLLDESYLVLSELESKYSNPVELLYEDAMLLEVSGRQAMLSQRVSYLACRKWSGASGDDYIALLRQATDQYSFAMQALINGAPSLGVKPPPTDEIASALQGIANESELIDEKIGILFETGTLPEDKATDLYEILADKMVKLERIAHLYAVYSKRVY